MSYKHLILGLLNEGPMSGYDINKRVKAALGTITTTSYGTLYPTLHKLLAEGYVEMHEVPQRSRPSKKVYSITERGRQDLSAWLRLPAATDQIRREFLLKLFLAKDMAKQDILTMIARRRVEMENLMRSLQSNRRNTLSTYQIWVMDYALLMCEAEINWLLRLEQDVNIL